MDQDQRAEDCRVQREECIEVKKAAKVAATAEGDRVVEEVKGCTEGPGLVAAAEQVVNATRILVELARELACSVAQSQIGDWRVTRGKTRKSAHIVSQLGHPLDGDRRKSLQDAVGKVQGLLGTTRLQWGLVASPYMMQGRGKILWTVCGGELVVGGLEVARTILKNLEVVWGVGLLVECWVENKMA